MPGYVVQFGAGNIGRGFMGDLFQAGGWETVFVEANPDLVDGLNRSGSYPLEVVGPTRFERRVIAPVRALPAGDAPAVARALAGCEFACTAVGVGVLPRVAPLLADGIRARSAPLNVILCENQLHCSDLLRGELARNLGPEELCGAGLVESVVSRMAPVVPEERRRAEPLLAIAEDYSRLPLDARGCIGPPPQAPGFLWVEDFSSWVERKLYIHNMGHALAAYLGARSGCRYVHEALESPQIRASVVRAMEATCEALARRHGLERGELDEYREDLLRRFENEAMRDTIERVARDPIRKLRPEDRLVGAARLCLEEHVEIGTLPAGIAAALTYRNPDDPAAVQLADLIADRGAPEALRRFAGCRPGDPLETAVLAELDRP